MQTISRRLLIKSTLMAGAAVPLAGILVSRTQAAALPPLDPSDPTAKSLGFVLDTTKVDDSQNPTHKPTQKCGVCAQFQGKAGDTSGGCNIFVGHSVPQGGWCKVWAQKPS
jgi:hypothetical protein